MESIFESFVGLYPLSKTLRFELVPQGSTVEEITKTGVLVHDQERAEAYQKAKMIIDEYHKEFIERSLQDVYIDWSDLAKAIDEYRRCKDDKSRQILRKVQEAKRKEIVGFFKAQNDFNKLFGKELFTELLPAFMYRRQSSEKDFQVIKSFDRFTTYFINFHDNRKNIYSSEEISTAISFRIVHDNFPKYYSNIASYEAIEHKNPEIIESAKEELRELIGAKSLSEWFEIDGFNLALNQSGIELYNGLLGGHTRESNKSKIQGINEFSNLFNQKNPQSALSKSVTRMSYLHKQILSDRERLSFINDQYVDDKSVYDSLGYFSDRMNQVRWTERLCELMSTERQYDYEKIYINEKELNSLSIRLYGDWNYLKKTLRELKTETENIDLSKKKNVEKLERWLKSEAFSVAVLDRAVSHAEEKNIGQEMIQLPRIFTYFFKIKESIDDYCKNDKKIKELADNRNDGLSLQGNTEVTAIIKAYLDSALNMHQYMKPFSVGNELEVDMDFYGDFHILYEEISTIIPVYNRIRNYITQKPYRREKYKLNFDNPTLVNGWDKNKEYDNAGILLFKNNAYYLGIMNAKDKPDIKEGFTQNPNDSYQKMVYKYFKDATIMIPKCTTQMKAVKEHFYTNIDEYVIESDVFTKPFRISKEIFDLNNVTYGGCKKFQDAYLKETGDSEGHRHALTQWIQFCMRFLETYKSTKDYDFSDIKDPGKYTRLLDFYKDVNQQLYRITFEYLSSDIVDKWVKTGKLFLFQIYSKDFAPGAKGRPNLHTMYWRGVFDPKNLQDVVLKLNGQAELFYREASISNPFKHKVGEKLVNKKTKDGRPISDELYQEIFNYVNAKNKNELSTEAKMLLPDVVTKDVSYEITKDRRYTEDKFQFHVPITINFKAEENKGGINNEVRAYLHKNKSANVIGIDRGERNLLYVSVIDRKGNILSQKSFNTLAGMDYALKIQHREKARDDARKSWTTIEGIKDLKEGYLSQVIHEITRMMVDYNAVVALEDLNFGFKRGRFKIERQVYQKFEKMFIDKLNYLFFKDQAPLKPGGLYRGYQLTERFTSFKELGKQSGFLFYVPAAYTSKIDPTTGFINAFDLKDLTNVEKKKDFLSRFDAIQYSPDLDMFSFTFDYKNFKCLQTCAKTKWTVYSNGKRIIWDAKARVYKDVYPTEELKALFEKYGISYAANINLKNAVLEIDAVKANVHFYDGLYYSFSRILQMRNTNSVEDYIVSPVLNKNGEFYNSTTVKEGDLPVDADANGAYHIALKGLYMLRMIAEHSDDNGRINNNSIFIKNEDWFRFVQNQEYRR